VAYDSAMGLRVHPGQDPIAPLPFGSGRGRRKMSSGDYPSIATAD